MANNVKPIRENGIILGKFIRESREAGESADGKIKWPAREKEFVLDVISCDEDDFSKENGFGENPTRTEYKVDEKTYNTAKYLDAVRVKYTLRNGERGLIPKGESCVLLEKTK